MLCVAVLCAALATACSPQPAVDSAAGAPPAHAFTLTDQHGKAYTVARPGSAPAALYFGFTHCKDVCPQTLALLGRARERAGLSPAQLRIVMVTVDQKRDTPAALGAFVRRIGVDAAALTGTPRQLRPVYRAYGVVVQPLKRDIGHTDFIYLIDGKGRLRQIVSPDTALSDVAKALKADVD